MTSEDDEQDRIWNMLYQQLVDLFSQHGLENAFGEGDFWVVDDNYGWKRLTVCISDLAILTPSTVLIVQRILNDFPNWEIVLPLEGKARKEEWPPMGLTVRKHEIIDGLQREYLPPPYNRLEFPGSRPGTGYD